MTDQEKSDLNAAVARAVYGWRWGHFGYEKDGRPELPTEPVYLLPPDRRRVNWVADEVASAQPKGSQCVPDYTSGDEFADLLVRVAAQGFHGRPHNLVLWQHADGSGWAAAVDSSDGAVLDHEAHGATLGEAVCRLALAVVAGRGEGAAP